jgi:HAD superfamily hydrolase (TIGR01549 family)
VAKGLLFDFDGTLYGDWKIWISIITETLSDHQILIDPHDALEKARSIIEKDGGSNGTLRISNVAAALARDRGVVRDDEIRTRFFQILDARMDYTGPDKSVVELLKTFALQGFRLGMVTFVRKPRITRRLDLWKLKQYFESVITPDDESDFKPSPRPFVRAMGQLQVQPSDCFVIGDEPVDMIGGKTAGTRTIGLPQGFFSREELERAGADYIIPTLNQLPDIVNK